MKKYIRNLISQFKGNTFKKEYHEIKQIKNENDLLQFHEKYLKKIIFHAYKNVPYYQDIFNGIGIIKNDHVDLSKFHEIPILKKETLRKNQTDLLSKDYKKRKWYYNSSGGSTGEPTKFIQDLSYNKWRNATNKFYYQDMLGIDESDVKKIELWGSAKDLFEGKISVRNKINDWLNNIIVLNSFKMTEKDMGSYISIINNYRPDLIRGYTSALYEIGKFAERNNLKIYKPNKLINAAETLTDEIREKIETAFGTKVFDYYGSRETTSMAGECKGGCMHIFSFNNLIEIIDRDNNPILEGQNGRVIVTNLHNYSMPFIRYELGDMAVLGSKKCTCGSILPCIKKISGRIEEQFIKKDGTIVLGNFFIHLIGVLYNNGFIRKFQIIQEDYDKIRILAVINKVLPEYEKNEIEQKIRLLMGSDCKIIWNFVDDIPKTPSGKYLYTKSLVIR